MNRVIDGGTRFYVRALTRALDRRALMLGLFAAGLVATSWLFRTVPSAFVPDEDEGYFISVIQAPAGASLEYTTRIAEQAEAILFKDPDIRAAFSVAGLQLQRRGAEQRPDLHAAQGLRRAARPQPLARGRAQPRARTDAGDPGRARDPVRATGDPGPLGLRRLPVRAARPDRRRDLAASPTPCARSSPAPTRAARWWGCSRASAPTTRSSWSTSTASKARSLDAAALGGDRRAPGVPGLGLRERLRLQQPRLPRLRPGRQAVPRRPERPAPALRARRERRDGAARERGAHARDDRTRR